MPEIDSSTIAPGSFLPIRHRRFVTLARTLTFAQLRRAKAAGAGTLVVHERYDGRTSDFSFGEGLPVAELTVLGKGLYPALVFGGSKGFGRAYVNELWSSENLTDLVRFLLRLTQPRRRRLDALGRRFRFLFSLGRRSSSTSRDRDNIHAHYDLSNEFFTLMLDETMAYSCAVFANGATTLYDAQVEKFDRICRKLALRPGEHVLEIGTGWGGFALHAAQHYGVRVTTTTISNEQRDLARQRVADAGLDDRIEVLDQHYRDLRGTYDALVSIEMIEAVDWRDYPSFFSSLERLVNDTGRVAIQAITINDQSFERAKIQPDFIRDLIFPGGCLPSVTAVSAALRDHTSLRVVDLEDIGLDYARTLSMWRDRVAEQRARVAELGFDDRFLRLWNLYLGYCEAAFLERHISDVQMVLHRAASPRAPRVA